MGDRKYHISNIKKGELGYASKIREELDELVDAEAQGSRIMAMLEASDLYGALEAWAHRNNLSMHDLAVMSDITKKAIKGAS
jgi:phosphoribosyl-ATP pyrophosphohydrolase